MIKGEETVKHLKDLRTRAKVALGRKVNSVTKMVNTMLEEELMKEYGEVHKAAHQSHRGQHDEDQVSEELRADVEKTDGETSQRLEEVSEVIKANLWSRHGERKVMFAVGEAEKVYEEAEATQIDLEAEFNKARGAAELARTAAEDERAQFALVQLRQDQAQRSKLAEAQIAAEEARRSASSSCFMLLRKCSEMFRNASLLLLCSSSSPSNTSSSSL
ncbi:hypothetical protein F7725_021347 [Dissostichus mawsoni]|uniref:Uncharacterized protein n=1 Tax=Dissostichus mawsoni TaxID=36200 RepID=A0A7J5YHT0_DISMA|nr:hypothetical protein F7725_021347 [Dissostichus mawsoni]